MAPNIGFLRHTARLGCCQLPFPRPDPRWTRKVSLSENLAVYYPDEVTALTVVTWVIK